MSARIVECVPNFSEGRRPEVMEAIVEAIAEVDGIRVLDKEMDKDHNRAVVTFVGEPEQVKKAAFAGCAKAAELIDLNYHTGEHPRIGATDVIPFIPISGVTVEECIDLARELGQEIAEKLNIPIYLYEKAATKPERENLANVREGQFEGLREAIEKDPARHPDFGEAKMHPKAGATAIGVRDFLVAYNIYLDTNNLDIAKKIGQRVRFMNGGFRYVKANGFAIKERGCVQVSMNLTNFRGTPMHDAFDFVKREAARYGINVTDSEVIGLVPLDAMMDVAEFHLQLDNFKREQVLENKLWGGGAAEGIPTMFLDEVASKSPAPGGGSVAALAGALAAALGSMVCRLTVGRKKYAAVSEEMKQALQQTERVRGKLTGAIETDAKAFNAVMKASKLPEETPEEKGRKEIVLQEAYKHAAEVPLSVMEEVRGLLPILRIIAKKGNVNSASDAGVAALMAHAGCEGALLNVEINVPSITDEGFKTNLLSRAGAVREEVKAMSDEILGIVRARIAENAEA
jgi:glutamate formiminotransferase/formiminotetrahydrofolate cyclodeaminase